MGDETKTPQPPAPKATITLAGVPLAATSSVAWKFHTGVQPYTAVFSCYKHDWDVRLKQKMGDDVDLVVKNQQGSTQTVRELTIMHTVASDSPNRVSFLVADRRWRWSYKLVVRDYNVPRKTGDRVAQNEVRPIENQVVVDEYDYRPASLKEDGKRWEAQDIVKDLLKLLEDNEQTGKRGKPKKNTKRWVIESFPIRKNLTQDGAYAIQNVILRDQGDAALARALSFIPGAEVYIDTDGFARVFDSTDLKRMEQYFKDLPPVTWDGDRATFIDRKHIRPAKVKVHYQREVEVVFSYSDDYTSTTSANPIRNSPFLENVLPTVDPETELTEWDSEGNITSTKKVPPGTWVGVRQWLAAMDAVKPAGSPPWDFEHIRMLWLAGDMEGALSGTELRGSNLTEVGSVSNRISTLREHFRQTFRINRRFTERIRDLKNVRIAVLDPTTGARAPAAVWGQATIIPTTKGKHATRRKSLDHVSIYRRIDNLPQSTSERLTDAVPSPARIVVRDIDMGIFSVQWVVDPYGLAQAYIPSHLKGSGNKDQTVTRDMGRQGEQPIAPGAIQEGRGATDSIYLAPKMELKAMLTIVPSAPNNKAQMHVVSVEASEIKDVFLQEYRIQEGQGPDLDVFIPPGEITARFAWDDDTEAPKTLERLLGLDSESAIDAGLVDDPETQDVDESEMSGFQIANQGREISGHSKAVAAELLSSYADNLHGQVSTALPARALFLRGNMAGATIQVASAPSAKVSVTHTFPGQSRPISRLALMPDAARRLIMGILPYGTAD